MAHTLPGTPLRIFRNGAAKTSSWLLGWLFMSIAADWNAPSILTGNCGDYRPLLSRTGSLLECCSKSVISSMITARILHYTAAVGRIGRVNGR